MKAYWERIHNGIVKENPAFILMLGMCPTLAVTTSAINGLGMGLSSLVVLAISNVVISLLRKMIPDEVRLPAFIVIVASFVTVVELLMEAYMESLYAALGIYIPLIVVNCIILGRAEAYASKNPPLLSLFDGLGMGLGFTIALVIIGSIRELLGAGSIFGIALPGNYEPIAFFVRAPGAFLVLAIVVAIMNAIGIKSRANKVVEGCDGCCASCASSGCDKKEANV
ncbi:MAG: electron transport complex subunit E [Firmicutes bacterium]|nr:electron transport complex subunit E [Bacillota bacterium]MDY6161000.1 electron transport complex subunit E [Candidatus Faecousia sp.]